MPFKIVKTIGIGKFVLTTVPSNWESEGVLYWPKKNVDNLRRDGNSKPENGWMTFNCIVKKANLKSYQKAEKDLANMCADSESDSDEEVNERVSKTFVDIDKVAPERMSDDELFCIAKMEPTEVIDDEPQDNTEPQENSINPNNTTQTKRTLSSIMNELSTKMNLIIESNMNLQNSVKTLENNQKVIYNNQQRLMLKINKIAGQFEHISKKTTHVTDKQKFDIQLITSLEELQAFEKSLECPETAAELKKKYSVICGKGRGRGINNAYILVDAIFDRHFMEKCSWAGGSRTSESKICFKSCTRVINFFFEIVYETDNTYTLTDCHNFFKVILKNSHSRSKSKMLRASTSKNRRKKLMLLNSKGDHQIFKTVDITDSVDQSAEESQPFTIAEMFAEADSMETNDIPHPGPSPQVKHTHPLETSV